MSGGPAVPAGEAPFVSRQVHGRVPSLIPAPPGMDGDVDALPRLLAVWPLFRGSSPGQKGQRRRFGCGSAPLARGAPAPVPSGVGRSQARRSPARQALVGVARPAPRRPGARPDAPRRLRVGREPGLGPPRPRAPGPGQMSPAPAGSCWERLCGAAAPLPLGPEADSLSARCAV